MYWLKGNLGEADGMWTLAQDFTIGFARLDNAIWCYTDGIAVKAYEIGSDITIASEGLDIYTWANGWGYDFVEGSVKDVGIIYLDEVADDTSADAGTNDDEMPVVINPADTDDDGDGYTENQGDCNDADAGVNPVAEDICGDSIDQNCDGTDAVCLPASEDSDEDNDYYTENQGDCNDADASINPGAEEICGDGIDQNCDGSDFSCDDVDNDGDGFTENEGDCNDEDATVNPERDEICGDGIDQDCDDSDLSCDDVDNDGDGFTENDGDCNDEDAEIHPDAEEICGDGIDQDCDGEDLLCPPSLGFWKGTTDIDGEEISFDVVEDGINNLAFPLATMADYSLKNDKKGYIADIMNNIFTMEEERISLSNVFGYDIGYIIEGVFNNETECSGTLKVTKNGEIVYDTTWSAAPVH